MSLLRRMLSALGLASAASADEEAAVPDATRAWLEEARLGLEANSTRLFEEWQVQTAQSEAFS